MFTPKQYRTEAAEYSQLVKTAKSPDEIREFQELERSFAVLADNEKRLNDNRAKTLHAKSEGVIVTSTALLLLLVLAATPVSARPRHFYHDAGSMPSTISCETVRSYVMEVGLVQARALARARGTTPSQEWRAMQCLAKRG